MNEIVIDVEHDGHLVTGPSQVLDQVEHPRHGCAALQGAFSRQLVHDPVRQRVTEWNAQFEHIHPDRCQLVRQRFRGIQARVTGADVGNECFLPRRTQLVKLVVDSVHGQPC